MARLLTLRTVSEAVALERDAVTRGIGAGVVIVGVVARLLVFSVLERASVIRGGGIDGEKETEVATGRVANGEGIKAEEGGGMLGMVANLLAFSVSEVIRDVGTYWMSVGRLRS